MGRGLHTQGRGRLATAHTPHHTELQAAWLVPSATISWTRKETHSASIMASASGALILCHPGQGEETPRLQVRRKEEIKEMMISRGLDSIIVPV